LSNSKCRDTLVSTGVVDGHSGGGDGDDGALYLRVDDHSFLNAISAQGVCTGLALKIVPDPLAFETSRQLTKPVVQPLCFLGIFRESFARDDFTHAVY
jgi:hypothetical protein